MSESSRFDCINGFAEELDELIYDGISNWLIAFRSPFTVYSAHFSYLVIFFSTISCGLLSYRHSMENGGKYSQFWWGALLHGIVSERGLTATKYWHAQAPIMFFGKQLPLHIVLLYPSIIYIAMIAVQRLKLHICTEPAAVGLIAMFMEIPFRMISVKFLHITYHDSDPLYYHKLCGVPWVDIFSSLVLASSYVAVYHIAKFYHFKDVSAIWDRSRVERKEIMITVMCGVSSPMFGFIQKILLFHFLHDFFNVNPISCLFFTISLYLSFLLCFETKKIEKHITEESNGKIFLFYQLVIFLTCLMWLALFGRPQNEISIGSHEPTGDCTTLICSRTPLGKPVKRKKYLCAEDIAARRNFVYSFDCLEDGPPCLGAIWYTICGSPIYNRTQFFLNVLSFLILISSFFAKILFPGINFLEGVKRLLAKFRPERPPPTTTASVPSQMPTTSNEESSGASAPDEVAIGFVFVKNDTQFLPNSFQNFKKVVSS